MKLLKKIKSSLSSLWKAAGQVDRSKGSRFGIMCDMVLCKLRFHAKIEEYLQYRFYDHKNCYRKNFLLKYHQKHLYRKVSEILNTKFKYSFYQLIPDLFRREIILAPACGEETFLAFFKKHKSVVVKPNKGSCGIGICVLEYENDQQIIDCFRNLKNDIVCEEYIHQHRVLQELNPSSVNTIRVVSLRHDAQNIDIISATLRSASSTDCFTDNLCSGGIVAGVDIDAGILSTCAFDSKGNRYTHHPVTGTQIIGLPLPYWDEAKELIKKAHSLLDQNMILGWDIAITETGPEIVEANSAPDPHVMQLVDGVPRGEKILKIIKNKKYHIYHH